jgi:TonB family protein
MRSRMTDDLRRLGLGFVTCLSISLLAVPAHGSAQQTPTQNSIQQEVAAPAVTPISELDMDAFAAKLVPEITKRHFSKVAVFGAMGPADELTVLGSMIGDALSVALARQANGYQVVERSAIRERLQKERLSDSMLLTGTLAGWISQLMGSQGLILVDFGYLNPPAITITAHLFDVRQKEEKALSTLKYSFVPDESQNYGAKKPFHSDLTLLGEYYRLSEAIKSKPVNSHAAHAACVSCPHPDFSEESRGRRFRGEIWLAVTVTSDGKAAEIAVVRPFGNDLDQQAVRTIRNWKFKPARDGDGKPVSERTAVEVVFELY